MRLIVDDLPNTSKECLFGWKHLEYSKWRCKFGGECELSTECRQCSHLITFATDINVATKDGTNLASLGTDCISRQAAIGAADVYMKRLCRYIGTSDDTRAYAFARGLLVGIKTDLGELPSAEPGIIRCKDCKHYKYGICKKAGLCVNKSPNGFCNWGERREEGET